MKFQESDKYTSPGQPRKIYVDIDETICFYPKKRRYDLAEPSKENIQKINRLYDQGHHITYWTSRGAVSGANYYDFTYSQLKEWQCKFHALKTGQEKPHYDLVIDDKAKRIEEIDETFKF